MHLECPPVNRSSFTGQEGPNEADKRQTASTAGEPAIPSSDVTRIYNTKKAQPTSKCCRESTACKMASMLMDASNALPTTHCTAVGGLPICSTRHHLTALGGSILAVLQHRHNRMLCLCRIPVAKCEAGVLALADRLATALHCPAPRPEASSRCPHVEDVYGCPHVQHVYVCVCCATSSDVQYLTQLAFPGCGIHDKVQSYTSLTCSGLPGAQCCAVDAAKAAP